MTRTGLLALGLAVVVATCSLNPPPAPISGDADTIGFLAGEWTGVYESDDTGRVGDIFFRLTAGADTAQGEVLMASRPGRHDLPEPEPGQPEMTSTRPPPVLSIEFIRAGGPWVYGALETYADPLTGQSLETTFTGRIVEGDRIMGQFKTSPVGSSVTSIGTWSVRRTGPPPRASARSGDMAIAPSVPSDTAGLPGVQGPTEEEMVAHGKRLFTELGCSYCHGSGGRGRMAPDLDATLPHRDFGWIYRMILRPDSMVRDDPIAKTMYEQYELEMPDRSVSPWEALALYEYLVAEVEETPPER